MRHRKKLNSWISHWLKPNMPIWLGFEDLHASEQWSSDGILLFFHVFFKTVTICHKYNPAGFVCLCCCCRVEGQMVDPARVLPCQCGDRTDCWMIFRRPDDVGPGHFLSPNCGVYLTLIHTNVFVGNRATHLEWPSQNQDRPSQVISSFLLCVFSMSEPVCWPTSECRTPQIGSFPPSSWKDDPNQDALAVFAWLWAACVLLWAVWRLCQRRRHEEGEDVAWYCFAMIDSHGK